MWTSIGINGRKRPKKQVVRGASPDELDMFDEAHPSGEWRDDDFDLLADDAVVGRSLFK
jgi:hypothetical protein